MTTKSSPNTSSPSLLRKILLGIGIMLIVVLSIAYYLLFHHITNSGLTFTKPLQIPDLLEPTIRGNEKVFALTPKHSETEFMAGSKSQTMGYNNHYLGPTIRVAKGDDVVINVNNQLNETTTVHWHGLHVPPEMDGTPHQKIDAGKTWQAKFPILNEAATMWYHPHPHGHTADQVFRGLAGLFIIDDKNSQALTLPKNYGIDDIPLIIQDRLFNSNGELHYELNKGAYYGDTLLVNGTHNPYLAVPAKPIRLRLLNGSNARVYHFGFDDNRQFHHIATDGGLLESPVPTTRIRLAAGERAEIIVDLSNAQEALLKSFPEDDLLTRLESVFADFIGNGHFEMLKLVPAANNTETTEQTLLPTQLNQITRWQEDDANKVRKIVMGGPITDGNRPTGPGPKIPINGRLMDMGRVDEVVTLDDIEIWEVSNRGGQSHPFHIHDIQFLILDRDGVAPSPSEAGWKDTVLVKPNETVRIIMQFTTYANEKIPYMYHCHILEHEDGGMMGQFLVVEPGSGVTTNTPIAFDGHENEH